MQLFGTSDGSKTSNNILAVGHCMQDGGSKAKVVSGRRCFRRRLSVNRLDCNCAAATAWSRCGRQMSKWDMDAKGLHAEGVLTYQVSGVRSSLVSPFTQIVLNSNMTEDGITQIDAT